MSTHQDLNQDDSNQQVNHAHHDLNLQDSQDLNQDMVNLMLNDPDLVSDNPDIIKFKSDGGGYVDLDRYQSAMHQESAPSRSNSEITQQTLPLIGSHTEHNYSRSIPHSNISQQQASNIQPQTEIVPKKREINSQTDQLVHHSSVRASSLVKILTWNILADNKNLRERTLRIIQIIKSILPDVICLQEVTIDSYELCKTALSNYHVFQTFIQEGVPYGDCILCRKDSITVVDPYYYDYPNTKMGRRLVGCELILQSINRKLHVLTTQLESSADLAEVRGLQTEVIKEVIKGVNSSYIIAGDFNNWSPNEQSEDILLGEGLTDAWIQFGCPKTIKYTYDGMTNKNINLPALRKRFDRIYYKMLDRVTLKSLRLIGINSTSPAISTPPSDHYGLLAEFQY